MSNIRGVIDLDRGWKIVRKGIGKLKDILDGRTKSRFTAAEYMELYTTIYNMCTQKPPNDYSKELYAKYRESIEEYVLVTAVPSVKDKDDEFMLRDLLKRRENHKILVKRLCRLFAYLDRYFIPRWSLPTLDVVGISCFPDLIHGEVWDTVISLIDQEREGRQIDRALLKNALEVFDEIGGKYHDFEAHLLKCTAEYYSMKSSSWIVEYSCPDYLLKAEECLKREKESSSVYLHSCSLSKLLEEVRRELLFVPSTQLLKNDESGFGALLRDNKVEELSRIYRIFCTIPRGMGLIAVIFKQHVIAEGMAFFQQAEDEKASVMKVIEFHYKYKEYVNEHFKGDTLLCNSVKEAFEVLCNKFVSKTLTAEVLATYCDDILKEDGSEKLSDEAIEGIFEKLLACIRDKDLFAEFYRRKLARRLLIDKGTNLDRERIALSKLKRGFGVLKLEGMLTDLTFSRENLTEFDEYLTSNPSSNPGIDLRVNVLTTAFWPTHKPFDLNLPPEMARYVEVYQDFYQTKTKKRKLSWINSLGTCYIDGKFEPKTIELIATTSQAAALVLFNASDRLSSSEIKTLLRLSDEDVSTLMHSLSCAKYKILNKEPNTNIISSTDYFEFNSKFTDENTRIKLPTPFVSEKKKAVEDVDKDRRLSVEASIVRIMKRCKVLSQKELAKECTKQLSHIFKPDHKAIMKGIKGLTNRDYLERDKDDPHLLKYLP